MAAQIAYGARLRACRFDKYRTREKEEQKPSLKASICWSADVAEARKAFASYDRVADAIYVTRDLVSEPPNVIYPESLRGPLQAAVRLRRQGRGPRREAAGEARHGGFARCCAGKLQPPRIVVMQWQRRRQGQGQAADRVLRQGRHLRHRRHLASSPARAWRT
jgi:leucyl aminopeptidase